MYRKISGTVRIDQENGNAKADSVNNLGGIGVKLFLIYKASSHMISGNNENVDFYRQRLILETKTDKYGRYAFYIREGAFCVCLDEDSIPQNMKVVNPSIYVDPYTEQSCDFILSYDDNARSITMPDVNFISTNLNYFTPDKIEEAFEKGAIDERNKILLYLRCLFDKEKFVSVRNITEPIKSGTTILYDILRYIDSSRADQNVIEAANRYISSAVPKLDRSYISPEGFFKINYTTKGVHAVAPDDTNGNGTPDYIEKIAEAFDHVKKVTCSERGFRTPILDKGKNTLEINVYDLDGVYGITFPVNYYYSKITGIKTASSKISIDNNYSPSKGFTLPRDKCMMVTAAHEFFHSVQYAYNVDADKWWKEASATWNEDEIYDDVNDYFHYLDKLFKNPEKPLQSTDYGGVVFAKYLSENYGGYDIIRRIWEVQGKITDSSVDAIDIAIRERYENKSIGKLFDEYTAFNYNPAQYYSEGALWKVSVNKANTFTSFPVSEQSGKLKNLAAEYQLFKFDGKQKGKTLKIVVDGSDNTKWSFKLQRRKISDGLCSTTYFTMDGKENRAEIVTAGIGDVYSEVCLIPANLEKDSGERTYKYSAVLE